MSDSERYGSDSADLSLARAIKALEPEMQPERDLWAGIERRIVESPHGRRSWHIDWMPYGVAASLLLAVTSLVMNLTEPTSDVPFNPISFEQGIDSIKSEYHQVSNPLALEFGEVNKSLDPATLEDLYKNLAIIEHARKDIEEQVRNNPDNPKLVEMLMWIHQREIELLKRDFASPLNTI